MQGAILSFISFLVVAGIVKSELKQPVQIALVAIYGLLVYKIFF